ncbi:MAG: CDP-alcohol phosphatidyltransferase family protein [Ectothiorhodospiraceae bacterium]|nr:CDP-alcohol phosphatidyltransferase family protein [Chromatiales bacterium]MCP5156990.1 CDP-alcohol phosphatidyltransferase family protein [Ectothiorhodospiraceae bacterium]
MSHDTWFHRLVRRAVRPLVGTPVTPNHLTAARLATGLAAAWWFTGGDGAQAWPGAVLFLVSMVLDRADGELARQSRRTSRFGHLFDLTTDAACNALAMIAIGFGLRHGGLGTLAPWLGLIAGLAIAWVLLAMVRMERAQGQGSATMSSFAGFDPDDALVIVPLAMVLGFGDALIVAAAIGAPLAAVVIGVELRRRRAGRG